MRQLEIIDIAWMAALCNWDDVVNAWGKRMGITQALVHRLTADTTHRLCGHDLCFIPLIGQAVSAVFIRPVALAGCHVTLLKNTKEVRLSLTSDE